MAFDSDRGVSIQFGGYDAGASGTALGFAGDTWEWDGVSWALRSTGGPDARGGHAVAYDPVRRRTVLFGGYDNSHQFRRDTWEWDGSNWTLVSTTGPSARLHHGLAYDSARGCTVLFGGQSGSGLLNDTWAWDGSQWTQVSTTGPSPRRSFGMAYDGARERTVIFGGEVFSPSQDWLDETWEWDGEQWSRLDISGPSGRNAPSLVYDSRRGRLVLFGGGTWDLNGRFFGDTWELGYSAVDHPPLANAGADFSVNEGQSLAMLDGSSSIDPDGDPLTFAWTQIAGTTVALAGADTDSPTFNAPMVAMGGETLSFQLTVAASGVSSADTVSVTVVNVNHPPVADAGEYQSVAEGSAVTLHGEDSFDIDSDIFFYSWEQVGGPPVAFIGADTAYPTFVAPFFGSDGAPGVVATLEFELVVSDGFPFDAPAPGFTFEDVRDWVTIDITNTNNDPTAAAGEEQTVDENSPVMLDGTASSDPDSDLLTYDWAQVVGPTVTLTGATTATPSFTVPFVSEGGADLMFELMVADGYGGFDMNTVVVHVQNANDPPLVSAARPTVSVLWPPNHALVAVGITGVSDPDNNATITITGVTQDEPTEGMGDGDTAIDAIINDDGTVLLRAERSGNGNGRVYHIHFTASDYEGTVAGVVTVSVPHQKKSVVIDDGELFDSTN